MSALQSRVFRVFLLFILLPAFITTPARGHSLSPFSEIRPKNIDAGSLALTWHTFLGENNGTDYGLGVMVDGTGNIYVTGISNEAWGTPVRDYSAASDAFVAKFDESGNLIWNTFLGGSASNDYGEDIFVDSSGNIYVTGLTLAGFGSGTWGNPVRPFTGQGDVFVAKLDSSGNLVWNTFLGSAVTDWGKGLVVPADGNVYVTGFSAASWGDQIVRPFTAINDAFVAQLDPDGNLQWTSFFGGKGFDQANSVATDDNGRLYLAGFSTHISENVSWGNPVRDYTTGGDAFVASVDFNGNLVWNTFLGGSDYDNGYKAAMDEAGTLYVTGISESTWEDPVRDYTFAIDVFAASLDSSGNLIWNTFLGGRGFDYGYGIDSDTEGHIFVAGNSSATWGDPYLPFTALEDGFAATLNPDGSLFSNTFLGGGGSDTGFDLEVAPGGDVYVTGSSTQAWGTPVSAYTPPTDAFVAKFGSPPLVVSTSLESTMEPGPSSFTVTFSEDILNPTGSIEVDDATNLDNYLLVGKGPNDTTDTVSCAGAVAADDERVTLTQVTYDAESFTSTITLTEALPAGNYRLFVCGTTSIVDLTRNALAGNGTTAGTDYTFDFTVTTDPTETGNNVFLPKTGFTPHALTTLPLQPANKTYSSLGDLWLEIPSQNLKTNIVGIAQSDQGWDVTWLGNNVGWLNGTAFPTWTGNSVLTGHNYNANGTPGPFVSIKNLQYGDRLIVHLYGQKYIFEVQSTQLSLPGSKEFALQHLENHSYLTLITCQGYNPLNDSYLFRRIIRAVLVSVESE